MMGLCAGIAHGYWGTRWESNLSPAFCAFLWLGREVLCNVNTFWPAKSPEQISAKVAPFLLPLQASEVPSSWCFFCLHIWSLQVHCLAWRVSWMLSQPLRLDSSGNLSPPKYFALSEWSTDSQAGLCSHKKPHPEPLWAVGREELRGQVLLADGGEELRLLGVIL